MRYGIFISFKKICCCRVDDRDRLYCFFEYGQFNRGVIFIRIRTFYDYQFGIEFVYRQDRICAETLITLVGNGIGVNIMAFLMKQTRVGVRLVEKAGPIVETKLSDTYISLFLLAVCCGMLMYIAVATFKKQPNILGTIAVFLCVSVFILAGFEHCIANMFYFGLVSTPTKYAVPLLIMILGNSTGGILLCKLTQHVQIQKNSENA